jgi:hypothetical protein
MSFLTETNELVALVKSIPRLQEEESNKFPFDQSNACFQLDAHIRDLDVRITQEAKNMLTGSDISKKKVKVMMDMLRSVRDEKQALFNKMNCQNELEKLKMQETAAIISSETKSYDEDVLDKSSKNSKIYLIIGGVILLASLLIIVKPKKK